MSDISGMVYELHRSLNERLDAPTVFMTLVILGATFIPRYCERCKGDVVGWFGTELGQHIVLVYPESQPALEFSDVHNLKFTATLHVGFAECRSLNP